MAGGGLTKIFLTDSPVDSPCIALYTYESALRDGTNRVTWGKAPPFGDDLSLTYLFVSTS